MCNWLNAWACVWVCFFLLGVFFFFSGLHVHMVNCKALCSNKFLFSIGSKLSITICTAMPHYPLCITSHCFYKNMYDSRDSTCWLHCRIIAQKLRCREISYSKPNASETKQLLGIIVWMTTDKYIGLCVSSYPRLQHLSLLWTSPRKVLCSDRDCYKKKKVLYYNLSGPHRPLENQSCARQLTNPSKARKSGTTAISGSYLTF